MVQPLIKNGPRTELPSVPAWRRTSLKLNATWHGARSPGCIKLMGGPSRARQEDGVHERAARWLVSLSGLRLWSTSSRHVGLSRERCSTTRRYARSEEPSPLQLPIPFAVKLEHSHHNYEASSDSAVATTEHRFQPITTLQVSNQDALANQQPLDTTGPTAGISIPERRLGGGFFLQQYDLQCDLCIEINIRETAIQQRKI